MCFLKTNKQVLILQMCVSASTALYKRRARNLRIRPWPAEPSRTESSQCLWGLAFPEGLGRGHRRCSIAVHSNPKRCKCPFGSEVAEAEFHLLAGGTGSTWRGGGPRPLPEEATYEPGLGG